MGCRRQPKTVFRPAPGLLPAMKTQEKATYLADWKHTTKDPSHHNTSYRGNNRMKTFFSRPQSLPLLHQFYATTEGFEQQERRLLSDDPPLPRPVLSTDSIQGLQMPGLSRHRPDGSFYDN